VEWSHCVDRFGKQAILLSRYLAQPQREISEKKWREAKPWVESHIAGKKYWYC